MKLSSRSPRTPSLLPDSVHRQLNMYVLAASAAGVGIGIQPAEAKIVYKSSHIPINVGGIVYLDLNHDGVSDFWFSNYRIVRGSEWGGRLSVMPAYSANGILVTKSSRCNACAAALPRGRKVGPNAPFAGGLCMASYQTGKGGFTSLGPWRNVQQAYLGLKFMIRGKIHFGWARVKMLGRNNGLPAVITGYAYETIPNTRITTGVTKGPDAMSLQPDASGNLGSLALGRR